MNQSQILIAEMSDADGIQMPRPRMCRKPGGSEATFYNWKAKYGGITVSEARRLRELEVENARLKKLLAVSMLRIEHSFGVTRACGVIGLSRSLFRYRSRRPDGSTVELRGGDVPIAHKMIRRAWPSIE